MNAWRVAESGSPSLASHSNEHSASPPPMDCMLARIESRSLMIWGRCSGSFGLSMFGFCSFTPAGQTSMCSGLRGSLTELNPFSTRSSRFAEREMPADGVRDDMYSHRIAGVDLLPGLTAWKSHAGGIELIGALIVNRQIRIERKQLIADHGDEVLRIQPFAAGVQCFETHVVVVGFGEPVQPNRRRARDRRTDSCDC